MDFNNLTSAEMTSLQNIEGVRSYCLSLPLVTEDFPFDETTLVFRVMDKIFAAVNLDNNEWLTLKCDPDYAIELRDRYAEISGAWHWNKKYWNQLHLPALNSALIGSLIRHSYAEVVKKMTRKVKTEHPELLSVTR